MGTKRKIATWRKSGKVFYAKPPDWPREVEYSCTSRDMLIEWAQNHGYMLRDGNAGRQDA